MKACSKQKLAETIGVSRQTLNNWLKKDKEVLLSMGVSTHAKVLPPHAVKYLSEKYAFTPPR